MIPNRRPVRSPLHGTGPDVPSRDSGVSVYIIGRDCHRTLGQALDSVYSQTTPVDEVIYLDDGSTDASLEIAGRYLDRGLVVLTNATSQGIPAARNRAAFACRNRWIAVLDADDRWHEEKIAKQTAYLETHPQVGLLGTFALAIDATDEPLGTIEAPVGDADIKSVELNRNCFVHSSVVFRRDAFERVEGYTDLAAAQDYDLMLKLSEQVQVANLPEPLTDYRIDTGSTSARKHKIQRACAHQARRSACRRRGLRLHPRVMIAATAHRLFLALVLFDPYIHWGAHQILFGDPSRGRDLLRRARNGGLRSRIVAMALLMIPDIAYKAIARSSLSVLPGKS